MLMEVSEKGAGPSSQRIPYGQNAARNHGRSGPSSSSDDGVRSLALDINMPNLFKGLPHEGPQIRLDPLQAGKAVVDRKHRQSSRTLILRAAHCKECKMLMEASEKGAGPSSQRIPYGQNAAETMVGLDPRRHRMMVLGALPWALVCQACSKAFRMMARKSGSARSQQAKLSWIESTGSPAERMSS